MTVQLNHTVVSARDSKAPATLLAGILGLPLPTRFGPFQVVELDNGVSLDFIDTDEEFIIERDAFLISDAEFDEIFARIRVRELTWWADPRRSRPGEINTRDGGSGMYFEDPNGHLLEILTRPFGSGD